MVTAIDPTEPLSPTRRPTVHDVAHRANVSFKTVSRVVNREVGVSPTLIARVEVAIAELGYRPDDRARRLRTSQSRTGVIGFILVDVSNPFFSSILRGIEEIARKHDYLVLSGSTDGDPARQDQLIAAFVARRVDGMIVVPAGDQLGPLETELKRGTPTVLVDLDVATAKVDLLRSDHEGGARTATEHLLRHGHRDIAFFGSPTRIFSAQLRQNGFRSAMHAAGLVVPDHRVVTGYHSPEEWHAIIADYLVETPRPTAIVTAQNFISLGALYALHQLGLHNVIAQVGFDDLELGPLVSPGLTVVPQSPLLIGRRSAELLFRRLDGLAEGPIQEVLKSELIERGSGEIRPGAAQDSR
jgi:LacI family transcriptional regulator